MQTPRRVIGHLTQRGKIDASSVLVPLHGVDRLIHVGGGYVKVERIQRGKRRQQQAICPLKLRFPVVHDPAIDT